MGYFSENRRIYAFLSAFLVTAVLLLSGLFIIIHEKHKCTGENCPVCAEIRTCAEVIHVLSEGVGTGAVAIFAYFIIWRPIVSNMAVLYLPPVSLVSLKIRLDD